MSNVVSQVFEDLIRCELKVTEFKVDISFVSVFLKDIFTLNVAHSASEIVQHILYMLTLEHTPKRLLNRVNSVEKLKENF